MVFEMLMLQLVFKGPGLSQVFKMCGSSGSVKGRGLEEMCCRCIAVPENSKIKLTDILH